MLVARGDEDAAGDEVGGERREVVHLVERGDGDDVGDGVVEEEGVEERAAALEGEGDAVAAEVTEDLDGEGGGCEDEEGCEECGEELHGE